MTEPTMSAQEILNLLEENNILEAIHNGTIIPPRFESLLKIQAPTADQKLYKRRKVMEFIDWLRENAVNLQQNREQLTFASNNDLKDLGGDINNFRSGQTKTRRIYEKKLSEARTPEQKEAIQSDIEYLKSTGLID